MTHITAFFLLALSGQDSTIVIDSTAGLVAAMRAPKPGTKILLKPGNYAGGMHFTDIQGDRSKRIVLGSVDPKNPARIVGGGSGLQFSDVSYFDIQDLIIERSTGNGLNIDDAGTYETPSHHVTISNVQVYDLPKGNHDGIKLSGVQDFRVEHCRVERWGGSAVDMVGCSSGLIWDSVFKRGGDSGVQCKGGSKDITISGCRFEDFGQRGVNIGGSTGFEYFRPPLAKVAEGERFEAKDVKVHDNIFVGGVATMAFVGSVGGQVSYNTIYNPGRWALRILQETTDATFLPASDGEFTDNLVIFRANSWASGGVNIGPGTKPDTFKFARNQWFCEDAPTRSRPNLPTTEADAVYGSDPLLYDAAGGDFRFKPTSTCKAGSRRFTREKG